MKKLLFFSILVIVFALAVGSGVSFAGRNISTTEYELVPFTPPGLNIHIVYPKGWEVVKSNPEKGLLFKAQSPEEYLFEIYRDKAKPDETLDAYTEYQKNWLKEHYDNYTEVSFEKEKTIGKYTGNINRYTYTYKDAPYEVVEFYFEDQKRNFYIVLLDVPKGELDDVLPLFEKLVAGIEIPQAEHPRVTLTKFVSPDSDFLIKYPSTWKVVPPKEDMVFSVTDGKGVYVHVLVHKLPIDMDLEGYVKSSGKWLKENLQDYEEESLKEYKNNRNLMGYVRSYAYTENGKTQYVLEYYFIYKLEDMNKGFTLVFMMPEGLDEDYVKTLRKLQKEILNSFSLIYG